MLFCVNLAKLDDVTAEAVERPSQQWPLTQIATVQQPQEVKNQ